MPRAALRTPFVREVSIYPGVDLALQLDIKLVQQFFLVREVGEECARSNARAPTAPVVAMLLGCGLRRSELLSGTVKTIQQRQAPLSGSPAKELVRKSWSFITFYFYVLSLEYPQALSSSI